MIARLRAQVVDWLGFHKRSAGGHSAKIVEESARERERLTRIVRETNNLVAESRKTLAARPF